MTTPNDFFTTQSLVTFGGATAATFVVPNALQAAMQFNPKWLALVVAQLVCLAVVVNSSLAGVATGPAEYVVAAVNGCLVYCSAMGITSVAASTTAARGPGAPRGKRISKSARDSEAPSPPVFERSGASTRRAFLTPWV